MSPTVRIDDERMTRVEPGLFTAEASEFFGPNARSWPLDVRMTIPALPAAHSHEQTVLLREVNIVRDREGDLRWIEYASGLPIRLRLIVYND